MDQLHTNVAFYTHSGSAPRVRAARGEHTLGIGFDIWGARLKQEGAPIDVILPREGAGWDMEATAIHGGTRNRAAARLLADWSVSRKANEMYNERYTIVALPGVANIPPFCPPVDAAKMFKNDFG